MESVITNVAANEQLYRNVEVTIQSEYDYWGQPLPNAPLDSSGLHFPKSDVQRVRYVRQDGKFRFDVSGTVVFDGEKDTVRKIERIRLFDGQKTRVLSDAVANIIEGAESESPIEPHVLLLSIGGYPVPLSTYMRGEEAMRGWPGKALPASTHVVTSLLGEEAINGLACQKVAISHIDNGKPSIAWHLWLAVERNYLPARLEAFTFGTSVDLPVGEGVVRSFMEIAPGIWFPSDAELTHFDRDLIASKGEQRLTWRKRFVIEKASVDPEYGVAFFQDLEIPNGAAVYEVVDQKIVRSYWQGAPPEQGNPHRAARRWVVLASFAAVGFLLLLIVGWARRRRTIRDARRAS